MKLQAPMPQLPLRDIHIPEPLSPLDLAYWWPPAVGWYVAIILIGIAAAALWLLKQRQQRAKLARAALYEMTQIEIAYAKHGDLQQLLRETSILLRRISLSYHPREDVASLAGEQWLSFLDTGLSKPYFSQGPGRLLLDGPYCAPTAIDQQTDSRSLINICRDWITAQANGESFTHTQAVDTAAQDNDQDNDQATVKEE